MTKICSRCETDNTDAAKICKLCGTPFALPQGGSGLLRSSGAAPAPAAAVPAPPAPAPMPESDDDATVMIRTPSRRPAEPPAPVPPVTQPPVSLPPDFPDFAAPSGAYSPPPAYGAAGCPSARSATLGSGLQRLAARPVVATRPGLCSAADLPARRRPMPRHLRRCQRRPMPRLPHRQPRTSHPTARLRMNRP